MKNHSNHSFFSQWFWQTCLWWINFINRNDQRREGFNSRCVEYLGPYDPCLIITVSVVCSTKPRSQQWWQCANNTHQFCALNLERTASPVKPRLIGGFLQVLLGYWRLRHAQHFLCRLLQQQHASANPLLRPFNTCGYLCWNYSRGITRVVPPVWVLWL